MRRIGLVLVLAACGLLPAMAQMPELRGGAMLDCAGLPCVDVALASGKHLKMLIDTGDVNSVLDTHVAKELGLEVLPVKDGDGKDVPGYGKTVLRGSQVGDAGLGDRKSVV